MKKRLSEFYSDDGPERVGLIIDGEIIEVANIADDPINGFEVDDETLLLMERAEATWHTHPNVRANLSTDDYSGFTNWPHLKHYVIGSDGVRCFTMQNNVLVEVE